MTTSKGVPAFASRVVVVAFSVVVVALSEVVVTLSVVVVFRVVVVVLVVVVDLVVVVLFVVEVVEVTFVVVVALVVVVVETIFKVVVDSCTNDVVVVGLRVVAEESTRASSLLRESPTRTGPDMSKESPEVSVPAAFAISDSSGI